MNDTTDSDWENKLNAVSVMVDTADGPTPLDEVLDAIESGGDVSVAWDDVTDKPTSFAPATHSHPISQVTGLQADLDERVVGVGVTTIRMLTQAEYDGLTPDPDTAYFITG